MFPTCFVMAVILLETASCTRLTSQVQAGEAAQLMCKDATEFKYVKWLKDGKRLLYARKDDVTIDWPHLKNLATQPWTKWRVLTIPNVSLTHAGCYTCQIDINDSFQSTTTLLTVIERQMTTPGPESTARSPLPVQDGRNTTRAEAVAPEMQGPATSSVMKFSLLAVGLALAITWIACAAFAVFKKVLQPRQKKVAEALRLLGGNHSLTVVGGVPMEGVHAPRDLADPERDLLIPAHRLTLGHSLGSGEFGLVLEGHVKDGSLCGQTRVAVKMPLDEGEQSRAERWQRFEREVRVMLHAGTHQNVLACLGYSKAPNGFPMAILELAPGGNLQTFLRECRGHVTSRPGQAAYAAGSWARAGRGSGLSGQDFALIARGVAHGMAHLTRQRLVHGDVATRNILIGQSLAQCKVSDFGLARLEDEPEHIHAQARVPFRWYPPEYFSSRSYTRAGDVWAYGVLLWELVSFAYTPYANITCHVMLGTRLLQGHRLARPPHCSLAMYDLMMRCWEGNPQRRPDFQEVARTLHTIANSQQDYVNMAAFNAEGYVDLAPQPGEKL
ncbi:tyrosine-protein kinase receptor Tie-1-like isoform X1 [Petromyzon marinus]|uniref:receptor protein-tyrosine kinase n=2 Tax=Petromyzon marinus TaxID=7757 RepID=A0AAJ7SQM2_PETMA|nr:tyrosine-protein kinase receptor Tie-1-like isoform X1 [Petromyzon marinus]